MALTRSFLRGLKLDEEQVSAIIEAHTETVDGLKGVNADIQKKLDEATKALNAEQKNGYQEKYEALVREFDAFKADQQAKEVTAAKEKAYVALLKETGVSEKRIEGILKYDHSKLESIELDKDGKIKTAKELAEAIKADWADFITAAGTRGAEVSAPPETSNTAFNSMSITDKMAYANAHPDSPDVASWLNN